MTRSVLYSVALLLLWGAGCGTARQVRTAMVDRPSVTQAGSDTTSSLSIHIRGAVAVTLTDPLYRQGSLEPGSSSDIPGWGVDTGSEPFAPSDTISVVGPSYDIFLTPVPGVYRMQVSALEPTLLDIVFTAHGWRRAAYCDNLFADSLQVGRPREIEFSYSLSASQDTCRIGILTKSRLPAVRR